MKINRPSSKTNFSFVRHDFAAAAGTATIDPGAGARTSAITPAHGAGHDKAKGAAATK